MKIKLILSIVLIQFLLSGCYDNVDNTPTEPEIIIQTTEVYVTTRLSGHVTAPDGDILNNYDITVNNKIHEVPADHFIIEMNEARKKGQTLRINKDGHQVGINTTLLIENDINHIQLIAHDVYSEQSKPQSSARLNLSKDINVDLTNTTYENGYEQDINLLYTTIDENVPLTSIGYDQDSHPLALESKGGFFLTVSDENKNELIVDRDNPIILSLDKISDGANGLFVLNEENDIWEFVADITEGSEVGILGRGYYTFANYKKGVFVEGRIALNDQKVAYQPMQWSLAEMKNNICATEEGRWISILPENERIAVTLVNPCGDEIQTEELTTQNDDLIHQNVQITGESNHQYLNTTIIDCDGNEVLNSAVSMNDESGSSYFIFEEQQQERWIAVCESFSVSAVNPDTQESGTQVDWAPNLNETIDILNTCSDYADGFSYVQIRDTKKVFDAFEIEIAGNRTTLKSSMGEIKLIFTGETVGMYPMDVVNISINDEMFGPTGYYISCESSPVGCGIDNFNVTHYDTEGQVRVEFSGNVWMQTLNPLNAGTYPIEGVIISKL